MRKKILIAPLNWGLGHASRCIPIIDTLIARGHHVVLASDGAAGSLLKMEYPALPYIELPSYNISYPSGSFFWHWLRKAPHLIGAMKKEHLQLEQIVREHEVEVVISDNRYGMYHAKTHNIIVTHQLNFVSPVVISNVLRWNVINRIQRFDECWIPDMPPPDNLTGILSMTSLSIPKIYIGILSRMQKLDIPGNYRIAVLLSGPEPNRTQLEKQLISLFSATTYRKVFLLGQPHLSGRQNLSIKADIYGHLDTIGINQILCASDIIVSRSGYSSLMDYYKLGKKAILIPTPNQPEQAYLARLHGHKEQFYVPGNDLLDLEQGIERLSSITPEFESYDSTDLPEL
ncbi:MAG: glycosyltransferase [Saprospiraceae bacterium]|nr:glycosyltransferase [Saprospiraceae bacterium]